MVAPVWNLKRSEPLRTSKPCNDPLPVSMVHTTPPVTMGGPEEKLGPRHSSLNDDWVAFNTAKPSVHATKIRFPVAAAPPNAEAHTSPE